MTSQEYPLESPDDKAAEAPKDVADKEAEGRDVNLDTEKVSASKAGRRKSAGGDGDKAGGASGVGDAEELPRAVIRRIVKTRLQALADPVGAMKDGEKPHQKEIQMSKDALLAFSESSRVFIHYLTATAHEFCRQRRRSTVTAEDVLAAVAEIHFPEFLPALQQTLEDLRAGKKAKKDTTAAKAGAGTDAPPANDKNTAGAASPDMEDAAGGTDASKGSGSRKRKERDISSIM